MNSDSFFVPIGPDVYGLNARPLLIANEDRDKIFVNIDPRPVNIKKVESDKVSTSTFAEEKRKLEENFQEKKRKLIQSFEERKRLLEKEIEEINYQLMKPTEESKINKNLEQKSLKMKPREESKSTENLEQRWKKMAESWSKMNKLSVEDNLNVARDKIAYALSRKETQNDNTSEYIIHHNMYALHMDVFILTTGSLVPVLILIGLSQRFQTMKPITVYKPLFKTTTKMYVDRVQKQAEFNSFFEDPSQYEKHLDLLSSYQKLQNEIKEPKDREKLTSWTSKSEEDWIRQVEINVSIMKQLYDKLKDKPEFSKFWLVSFDEIKLLIDNKDNKNTGKLLEKFQEGVDLYQIQFLVKLAEQDKKRTVDFFDKAPLSDHPEAPRIIGRYLNAAILKRQITSDLKNPDSFENVLKSFETSSEYLDLKLRESDRETIRQHDLRFAGKTEFKTYDFILVYTEKTNTTDQWIEISVPANIGYVPLKDNQLLLEPCLTFKHTNERKFEIAGSPPSFEVSDQDMARVIKILSQIQKSGIETADQKFLEEKRSFLSSLCK